MMVNKDPINCQHWWGSTCNHSLCVGHASSWLFPPYILHVCDCATQTLWVSPHGYLLRSHCMLFVLFSTSHIQNPTATPLPSLLTPALISSLGCCSGSLLSAALHAALLTFFTAPNFIPYSLSPRSHGASLLHRGTATVSFGRHFLFPHQICLCVCRPGENSVGGRKVCK